MNRFYTFFIAIFLGLVLLSGPTQAFAEDSVRAPTGDRATVRAETPPKTVGLKNPLKVDSIGALVKLAVEVFSIVAVIFAVAALVWVGFQYVMSQGKPEKRKDLNAWLLYIVIGLAIVISARVIVDVVLSTAETVGVDTTLLNSARSANK